MCLIQATDLTKVYASSGVETRALQGVVCRIKKGEFVAIMGPSGSGKSTLMHILGLLEPATSGSYLLNDTDVSKISDDDAARLRNQMIGFVFQSFNLLPRASVSENVELPLLYDFYTPHAAHDRKQRVAEALAAVGMTHRQHNLSNQLSGGEKQRVAIARALVNDPQIIFADEPTGNLDSKSGLQVMGILQHLHAQGRTIILVTHETITAEHAERILTMKDGRLIADTPVVNRRRADAEGTLK